MKKRPLEGGSCWKAAPEEQWKETGENHALVVILIAGNYQLFNYCSGRLMKERAWGAPLS